ncbi:MAG TPA: EF-hand domain-containing protein [Opitutus sp.]|nr:EF-hand domain-containing protein [Opitutus sp.]
MKSKRLVFIILLALTGALAVPAVRADDSAQKEKPVSKRILKKYDKDGDGKLSAEEKAAWEADREKAKADRAAKQKAKKESAGTDAAGK